MGVSNHVKSIYPASSALNIPLNASVKIVFNNVMKKDTLNMDTIYLSTSNKKVEAEYTYVGMTKELTIRPVEELSPSSFYRITVKSGSDGPKDFTNKENDKKLTTLFETREALPGEEIEPPEEPEEPVEPEVPEEPVQPDEPEEPVVPEEPEDPFEPVVESLYLKEAFPKSGQILNHDSPIVLVFSEKVTVADANHYVKLVEKNIVDEVDIPMANKRTSDSDRHVFTPTVPLDEGVEYELVIRKGLPGETLQLNEDIHLSYTANWHLMYTSLKSVRLMLGDFADSLSDADINYTINQESKAIYQLMLASPNYVESQWGDSFPYAASQYVLYKVAYLSMVGQTIAASSGIRRSVSLGDFQTSSSENTSKEVTNLLKLLEMELDKWWRRLNGEHVDEIEAPERPNFIRNGASTVRGEVPHPTPELTLRVPFRDIGG